ncbi:MAG: InlB B-repeat-containing protein, partial [Clostridia bacterium]
MKKKFYYLVLVLSLIFVFMAITACNGDNPAIVQPPTVTYDGVTQTLNWVAEKPLTDITILISGKTYNVTGSPYSIKQLQLEDGEYQLQFKCVYNGAPFSTFFIINIGEPIKDGKRIEFVDEYGKLIKAIYKSIDYVLTAEDYPTLATKNGVNYSWSVVAGEVINKNITISVVASYTEYTITYNLNGGNINGKTTYTEKYTIQSKKISIISPLKDNYLFGGYYDNENFSGMLISQIDYDNPKDYILFAKWKEISPDEKILLDCFKNTSALKYFTYVQVAPDGISEIAIDKDGYYYHYKKNNETKEVLTGGTLYNYTNKIRVPVSNEYADSVVAEFCLPDFSTDVISATIKESSASIVKYEVVTINGVMSVEVTGNIVTKIEMTQEGQTASISILTTPFERIAPKVEDFKEQININVFVIGGINDGREYLYKATIGGVINNAIDMKNCTFESEMKQYQTTNREWAFVGYFTDK